MISRIAIKNFQSLYDIEVELAAFTVIIGPSSSGKSAFTRALRTLTSNKRGTDFISHGERIATITATTDRGAVSLKRGKQPKDNEYRLIPNDPAIPESTFTKLEGTTPPEVSSFIGIESANPINYAGQFDHPYLLSDSAGEVARSLGQLTNVSVIFEAARESNRRKLTANQDFKSSSQRLESIKESLPQYASLKQQQLALTTAEALLENTYKLQQQIDRLQATISTALVAEQIVRESSISSKPLPSLSTLKTAHNTLEQFQSLLRDISTYSSHKQDASTALGLMQENLVGAQSQYINALIEAGTCPTCHQDTKHLHPEHS